MTPSMEAFFVTEQTTFFIKLTTFGGVFNVRSTCVDVFSMRSALILYSRFVFV